MLISGPLYDPSYNHISQSTRSLQCAADFFSSSNGKQPLSFTTCHCTVLAFIKFFLFSFFYFFKTVKSLSFTIFFRFFFYFSYFKKDLFILRSDRSCAEVSVGLATSAAFFSVCGSLRASTDSSSSVFCFPACDWRLHIFSLPT